MTAGAVLAPTVIPLRLPVPGRLKRTIDTATPIELHCHTSNTCIYYTVDGSKPNPFAWIGCSKQTHKYKSPIYLNEGKQCVKAVAVDLLKNRESPVVTKTFYVEKSSAVPIQETASHPIESEVVSELRNSVVSDVNEENGSQGSSGSDDGNNNVDNESNDISVVDASSNLKDEEQLQQSVDSNKISSSKHSNASDRPTLQSETDSSSSSQVIPKDDNEFEELIIVPEKHDENKIKFCECKLKSLNDVKFHFCSLCGKLEKSHRKFAVPSNAQMGICPSCHCHVPTNVPYCILCETRFLIKNHVFIGFRESKICQACYSINALDNDFCTLCERNLPNETQFVAPKPELESTILPSIIQGSSNFLSCNECGRINSCTARYCDWCGIMLELALDRNLECPLCHTSSNLNASFCHNCGLHFQPPINEEIFELLHCQKIDKAVEAKPDITFCSVQTDKKGDVLTMNKFIQTDLSSKMFPHLLRTMHKIKAAPLEENLSPPVYAVSPGRGFWRQQINHIIAHLKSFAYNNLKFRAQISNPRLMQLLEGTVKANNENVIIQLIFSVKQDNTEAVKPSIET